jgi:hypothetical protein
MPHELYEWLDRVKAVEREYNATRLAMDRLSAAIHADPNVLTTHVARVHVRDAQEKLQPTYIVLQFAVFETALRIFWRTVKRSTAPSRMSDLMNGIASKRAIPNDLLHQSHEVRKYRNAQLHVRSEAAAALTIAESRSRMCHFLSFLPPNW